MSITKLRNISAEDLLAIINITRSKSECLIKLGISPRNSQAVKWLTQFIKDYDVNISHHSMGVPLSTRYSKEIILHYVNQSICWTDLMKLMGIRFIGSNINTVKKLVKYYDISTSHFNSKKAAIINRGTTNKTPQEIFCENSSVQRSTLKNAILRDNLIPYKCKKCDNAGIWQNAELVLQLEHINGVNNDNRLENICFLCPNCHSQTLTFAGRNTK